MTEVGLDAHERGNYMVDASKSGESDDKLGMMKTRKVIRPDADG